MKHLSLLAIFMILTLASFAQLPATISGPSMVCVGSSSAYSDTSTGGTWSSSNPAIAVIGSITGSVTGISAGVTTITYDIGTGYATMVVTIEPTPPPITGVSVVCAGSCITLMDAAPGGVWSCSAPAIVSLGTLTGVACGVTTGSVSITYSLATGCYVTHSVTVNSAPAAFTVTGGGFYCSGGSGAHIGLSGSELGVNYQLYNGASPVGSAIAGTGSALDFGSFTAAGTYTIVATSLVYGCSINMTGSVTITVGAAPTIYLITGGGSYCAGGTGVSIGLSATDAGVNYQLYIGGVATGSAMAGTGSAITFGTFTTGGTYSIVGTNAVSGCSSTMSSTAIITVSPLPTSYTVTGGGSYCSGGAGVTIGLSGSSTGISYQLYAPGVPVGSPVIGTGGPISFGLYTTAGTYTVIATDLVTGCTSAMTGAVTVSVLPSPAIFTVSSPGTYCAGTSGADITLSSSSTGDTYTLDSGGVAVGVLSGTGGSLDFGPHMAGSYTITGTTTGGCSLPMFGTITITLSGLPSVGATSTSVACDGSYTLTASGALTYSWAPSTSLSCTTCSSAVSNPSATTVYTVTGTDGSGCTGTATVSVDGNRIMGTISPAVSGTIRVWLIQFNPSDSSITAIDSMDACTSGGTQYYDFADPAAGSYLAKAYLLGSTPGTSGYIPTYGTSADHWYAASSVSHAAATDNMNITMMSGTVPSGPGFISGFVAAGAGKGTSGIVPVEGMLIYLMDASNNVLTYTYTDAGGNYSFSSLANASYVVYPEDYLYHTTPSPVLVVSSVNETVTGVNFRQHTTSKTITPVDNTSVNPVSVASGISLYPNPVNDKLTISWAGQMQGSNTLTITDIAGRELYRSTIEFNAASGTYQVYLNNFTSGMYLVNINGEKTTFTGRIVIE